MAGLSANTSKQRDDSATSFAPAVSSREADAGMKAAASKEPQQTATAPAGGQQARQKAQSAQSPLDALTQHYEAMGQRGSPVAASTTKGTSQLGAPERNAAERAAQQQPAQLPDSPYAALAQTYAQQGAQRVGQQVASPEARAAAEHPHTVHVNPAQGWQGGPTGYVGFDRLFGANAGVANRTADAIEAQRRAAFEKAQQDLASRQADYSKALQLYGDAAAEPGHYWDPTEAPTLDTGSLGDEFADVNDQYAALGRGAGGVQALSPGMSRFGAGLVSAAGEPQFERLQRQYGDIGNALSDAGVRAQADAAAAQQSAQDRQAATLAQPPPGAPTGDFDLNAALAEGAQYAQTHGYPDLDTMLRSGYDRMTQNGDFTGSYEDYKQQWLEDRWHNQHATAGDEG